MNGILVAEGTSGRRGLFDDLAVLSLLAAESGSVVLGQGEGRRHMNLPPLTVIRDFRSDLYQMLNVPFHRPSNSFAPQGTIAGALEGGCRPGLP